MASHRTKRTIGQREVLKRRARARMRQAHSARQRGSDQEVTQMQARLHHALQDPLSRPTHAEQLGECEQALRTVISQRDDALKQLNDRANIAQAVRRLDEGREALTECVKRWQATVEEIRARLEDTAEEIRAAARAAIGS